MTFLALTRSGLAPAQIPTPDECAVVDVDRVGWERLTEATSDPAVNWWVEAGDERLACGSPGVARALEAEGIRLVAVHPRVEADHLRLGRGLEPDSVRDLEARVLVRAGSSAVLLFEGILPPPVVVASPGERDFRALVELPPHLVLARQAANAPPRPTRPLSAETRALADEVDAQQWFDGLVTLASHNRYTHGSGIIAARDWIAHSSRPCPASPSPPPASTSEAPPPTPWSGPSRGRPSPTTGTSSAATTTRPRRRPTPRLPAPRTTPRGARGSPTSPSGRRLPRGTGSC